MDGNSIVGLSNTHKQVYTTTGCNGLFLIIGY